ncbi:hypothetical protein [Paenibacillus glycanilyticus]|uniref:Uncharacterized protein n=1 Tax=Paenibacillus glycanilyticus TaxID=126569 RepID=A0ABQ6GFB9_9BACL|nr:hypothetical protein [Paenibacillus glycanilyticus]GLX69664.1 hypothetical protein MU1_40090 [Paenibacillus glycanilyticus]
MKMATKKFITVLSLTALLSVSVISPASAKESSPIVTTKTESFTVETFADTPNADGFYDRTGFKVVSATTTTTVENGNPVAMDIAAVEDYYDLNGNYINTVVKDEEMTNDYTTGEGTHSISSMTKNNALNEGSQEKVETIQEEDQQTLTDILDTSEEQKIKQFIDSNVAKLPEAKSTEVTGITTKQLNEIKEKTANIQASRAAEAAVTPLAEGDDCPTVSNGIEMCGAFDNYYRHNIVNGDFTTSSLGFAGEDSMYTVLHGSISGNTAKATRLANFKKYINSYQKYIILDMQVDKRAEAANWWIAVASFVTLVAGWSTGPIGWTAIVLQYANAGLVFASLTSAAYGSYSNLQYSKNSTSELSNSITQAKAMFTNGDANYGSEYVFGY